MKILKRFNGYEISFPQTKKNHKHVNKWVHLSDGSAIGWNESPLSGYSFPRVGVKTVNKIYPNLNRET